MKTKIEKLIENLLKESDSVVDGVKIEDPYNKFKELSKSIQNLSIKFAKEFNAWRVDGPWMSYEEPYAKVVHMRDCGGLCLFINEKYLEIYYVSGAYNKYNGVKKVPISDSKRLFDFLKNNKKELTGLKKNKDIANYFYDNFH